MHHQLEIFPDTIRIERIDPDRNMRRFYRMRLQPDLFGGVHLLREWGRVGASGQVMCDHYQDAGKAVTALLTLYRAKLRRGYELTV